MKKRDRDEGTKLENERRLPVGKTHTQTQYKSHHVVLSTFSSVTADDHTINESILLLLFIFVSHSSKLILLSVDYYPLWKRQKGEMNGNRASYRLYC